MPDFRLAEAEFGRQLDLLEHLLDVVEIAALNDPGAPTVIANRALPILPAGAQNTMTASTVIILAAHFEEYVRQQIQEYARAVALDYGDLEPSMLEKLTEAYWKAGTAKISRIKTRGSPNWSNQAGPLLRSLSEYPVESNLASFDPKLLCETEANMRWDTLTEVCSRVGISKLAEKMHRDRNFRAQIGDPRVADAAVTARRVFNEFIDLRNVIVHSISQDAGIGINGVRNWIRFFRSTSAAFGAALDLAFVDFQRAIESRRRGAGAAAG